MEQVSPAHGITCTRTKTLGSSYDRAPRRGVSQAQSRQDFKDYYQSENAAVNGI